MIVDCHAHLFAPEGLYAFRADLLADGGYHPLTPKVSQRRLETFAARNVEYMDSVGTDVQLLSPRPYHAMHSVRPARILPIWTAAANDVIARTVALYPNRFAGVAGLPIGAGQPVEVCFDELHRAIDELGFVGVCVNPDPYEGTGFTPGLGDEFWYPLYAELVELDVPALVHAAGCFNERETYSEHFITEESVAIMSLMRSRVFDEFPDLRIVVAHGGGSVPYQIGRWQADWSHNELSDGTREDFTTALRRLWFDTVLHHPLSLELLLRTVGPDRCLFGTERPGSGTSPNPRTGRDYDDLKPVIDGFDFLTDAERTAVFAGNARTVYPRLSLPVTASSPA